MKCTLQDSFAVLFVEAMPFLYLAVLMQILFYFLIEQFIFYKEK